MEGRGGGGRGMVRDAGVKRDLGEEVVMGLQGGGLGLRGS